MFELTTRKLPKMYSIHLKSIRAKQIKERKSCIANKVNNAIRFAASNSTLLKVQLLVNPFRHGGVVVRLSVSLLIDRS